MANINELFDMICEATDIGLDNPRPKLRAAMKKVNFYLKAKNYKKALLALTEFETVVGQIESKLDELEPVLKDSVLNNMNTTIHVIQTCAYMMAKSITKEEKQSPLKSSKKIGLGKLDPAFNEDFKKVKKILNEVVLPYKEIYSDTDRIMMNTFGPKVKTHVPTTNDLVRQAYEFRNRYADPNDNYKYMKLALKYLKNALSEMKNVVNDLQTASGGN